MRRKKNYFPVLPGSPHPLAARVTRRVSFSEVDAMAVAWHGRYAYYFEEAYAELTRKCGLGYEDFFKAGLRAPIVQFHVDYFRSLFLEEEITVEARLIWDEGARINMEYTIYKADGTIAATGYTVQMFIEENGAVCLTMPKLFESCRNKWQRGEFA